MRLPPCRRFLRSLAWASLALTHSFLGGGDDARAEVHSLPLALDPITVLDLTGTSVTTDTQPYVLDEMTGLSVTLEVETVESVGLVVGPKDVVDT